MTGKSRANLIPESHNYPGFTVSGPELLENLREQAERYGAKLQSGRVEALSREADGIFVAQAAGKSWRARTILLATGIVDESPALPGLKDAIYRGALRFCPICDAYEALDKRIGVLGHCETADTKALFLRSYSKNVVLLAIDDPKAMSEQCSRALHDAGVEIPSEPTIDVERNDEKISAILRGGKRIDLDVLYPALGCEIRSDLATALGARCDEQGALLVDDKQRTSVPGLYAAGDVVSDLASDQRRDRARGDRGHADPQQLAAQFSLRASRRLSWPGVSRPSRLKGRPCPPDRDRRNKSGDDNEERSRSARAHFRCKCQTANAPPPVFFVKAPGTPLPFFNSPKWGMERREAPGCSAQHPWRA